MYLGVSPRNNEHMVSGREQKSEEGQSSCVGRWAWSWDLKGKPKAGDQLEESRKGAIYSQPPTRRWSYFSTVRWVSSQQRIHQAC